MKKYKYKQNKRTYCLEQYVHSIRKYLNRLSVTATHQFSNYCNH